jgi:hypothetical protein
LLAPVREIDAAIMLAFCFRSLLSLDENGVVAAIARFAGQVPGERAGNNFVGGPPDFVGTRATKPLHGIGSVASLAWAACVVSRPTIVEGSSTHRNASGSITRAR